VFFPNRVPEYEKTEETLKYLYQLSCLSTQRTKELQALTLVQDLMVREYRSRAARTKAVTDLVLGPQTGLSHPAEEVLNELTDLAMTLKLDPLDVGWFELARGLSGQCDRELEVLLRVSEMQGMEIKLQGELERLMGLKGRLELATRNQEIKADGVDEKIAEWTRGIKLTQAKTEEYQSRSTNAKVFFPSRRSSLYYSLFEYPRVIVVGSVDA